MIRTPKQRLFRVIMQSNDMQHDWQGLWDVVWTKRPKTVVELGTRTGVSTKVMADAAPHTTIITVDPVDCTPHLLGWTNIKFIRAMGEEFYNDFQGKCDILFIDTDPHAHDQTIMWLNTWVSNKLAPDGIALFHDSMHSGVGTALKEWTSSRPEWELEELGGEFGMAALRRRLES